MIRCKWIQWQIERHMDAGIPLPPKLTAHITQCCRCEDSVRRLQKIHTLLSQPTADRLTRIQHRRIETAVLRSLGSAPLPRGYLLPLLPRVAAVAALLLVGILLLHRQATPPDTTSPMPLPVFASEIEIFGHSLPQLGKLTEEPLRQELHNLTQDARRAAAFLLNCAPGLWDEENL